MPVIPGNKELTSDLVDGLTNANDLSATYPAITKKDLSADCIAGVAGANSISATYPAITKKDISADQIAGVAGSASMSSTNVAATMNDLLARFPVGAGLLWFIDTPPAGFLECNGSAIFRTTYAALFSVIGTTWGIGDGSTTFNIPDFRAEFLRGWDHGRGIDSGRAFASWQDYDVKAPGYSAVRTEGAGTKCASGTNYGIAGYNGTETRPRNIAVMFCIKY